MLFLKKLGHQGVVVANGMLAIEKLQHHTFDLVIMDIDMPVLDGISATQLIPCLEAGMNDYISKPIDIKVFEQKITSFIENLFKITA